MAKRIKAGEEVVVIAGSDKGKRGKVIKVLPETNRILVEGVHIIKKHQKRQSQEDEGGIIEREASIDYSNVMLASRFDAKGK